MIVSRCSLINSSNRKQNILTILQRLKSNKRSEKSDSCSRALNHFDDFYASVFLKRWSSIRLGLLSSQKQVAVINNFGNVKETEEFLINEGAFDMRSFLNVLKEKSLNVENTSKVKVKNKVKIDEIILRKRELEQEKALSDIFPADKDSKLKDTFFESEKNEKQEDLPVYDPEEPKTSIKSDLSTAEIDSSRLILPYSNMQNTVLHDFVPVTQLRGLEGFVPESEYYKYYQSKLEMPVVVEDDLDLNFPESLKVYTLDRGDMTELSEPNKSATGVYNYLNMDGADLLTALVLNVQKEDKVLDLCSPNGNIAFCIFQTLPKYLVCIDNKSNNTEKIFSQYLFDYSSSWQDLLLIATEKFIKYEDDNLFDKILVNVPCTQDKVSVFENEDNIFNPKLIKKRLGLPKFQVLMLAKALKLVKPGGTVLYSTTTLSPVQNDGVVNEALRTVWEESRMECTVKNLSPALAHTSEFFRFADFLPMNFGTLILPFIPSNFGPRYFCKIIKNEN